MGVPIRYGVLIGKDTTIGDVLIPLVEAGLSLEGKSLTLSEDVLLAILPFFKSQTRASQTGLRFDCISIFMKVAL
jgi:hypothetical protein